MAHVLPCPACRKKVSSEAPTCPRCGHPLAGDEKFQARRKSRRRSNVTTWLVALGLLCYCGSRVSSSPEKVEPAMIPAPPKAERDARARARAAAQAAETRSKITEARARDREVTAEERAVEAKVPDQEGYEVVGVIQRPPIKLAIDVRLEEPIPEDDLVTLAHKLYSEYSGGDYARVFMTYRLPETPPGKRPLRIFPARTRPVASPATPRWWSRSPLITPPLHDRPAPARLPDTCN